MTNDATNTTHEVDIATSFAISDAAIVALSDRGIDNLCHPTYQPYYYYSSPTDSVESQLEGSYGREAGLKLSVWAHAYTITFRALLHEAGRPAAQVSALRTTSL